MWYSSVYFLMQFLETPTRVPLGSQPELELGIEASPYTSRAFALSFVETKRLPIHSWFPYVEGFSADYAHDILQKFCPRNGTVFDPFGGAGTVPLEASMLGLSSSFTEINPFMAFVADTKTNGVQNALKEGASCFQALHDFVRLLCSERFKEMAEVQSTVNFDNAFPGRDFYVETDLKQLLAARSLITQIQSPAARKLALLALTSITVAASNMTRRADLRRRRPDEYKTRVVDVPQMLARRVSLMSDELKSLRSIPLGCRFVGEDARAPRDLDDHSIDLILTSPPYLNGTNYFRNTKLELWMAGFIESEVELGGYTDAAICSGINNVNSRTRKTNTTPWPTVNDVIVDLTETAYDKRIPLMVKGYFEDMKDALRSCAKLLKPTGRLCLDIGDSKFCGVHVPTDRLLVDVAASEGLELIDKRQLAKRYSRDKSELQQVELLFGHA